VWGRGHQATPQALTAPPAIAPSPQDGAALLRQRRPVRVVEFVGEAVALDFVDSLAARGAGGKADTSIWTPQLFWEPPPVRLFAIVGAECGVEGR
jgi:hypothetical protein